MKNALETCLVEGSIVSKINKYHELIKPYVVGNNRELSNYTFIQNETEFDNAFEKLKQHIRTRISDVNNYLSSVNLTPVNQNNTNTNNTPNNPITTEKPDETNNSQNNNENDFNIKYSTNDWGTGTTVNLVINNNSTTNKVGWEISFTYSGDQKITNLWNAKYTQSGKNVVITNDVWNETIPAGGKVEIGFNISYTGSNISPTNFSIK